MELGIWGGQSRWSLLSRVTEERAGHTENLGHLQWLQSPAEHPQLGDNEVSRKGQELGITRWQEKTFKGNSYAWYLDFSNRGVYTCIKICQIVYSPWVCKVSDAESTHTHTHTHTHAL